MTSTCTVTHHAHNCTALTSRDLLPHPSFYLVSQRLIHNLDDRQTERLARNCHLHMKSGNGRWQCCLCSYTGFAAACLCSLKEVTHHWPIKKLTCSAVSRTYILPQTWYCNSWWFCTVLYPDMLKDRPCSLSLLYYCTSQSKALCTRLVNCTDVTTFLHKQTINHTAHLRSVLVDQKLTKNFRLVLWLNKRQTGK